MQVNSDSAMFFCILIHRFLKSLQEPMENLSNPLINILRTMPSELQAEIGQGADLPQRCFLQAPTDTGTFILPMKQSFMKDPRLMPGTKCMLALLVGWAGKGRALELTQARIAKHIGRSVRQVYRYLKDAVREGYLTYNYTKNRLGMITGLKVFLSFDLLRHTFKKRKNQARTHVSDTNPFHKDLYKKDMEIESKLESLRLAMGLPDS